MTDEHVRRKPVGGLLLLIVVTGIWLAVGFAVKDLCTRHDWDTYQYRTSCYNDIYALYSFRALDREPIPYVHGDGVVQDPEVGDLEYPAGTGIFIAAMALNADGGVEFFRLNAIWLGAAGLITAAVLWALVERTWRTALFALGPPVALYAFHNWDLLAVVLMCGGLLAYRNRLDGSAGALLGLGAAAKLFPGLLIPVLMLSRRREGRPWPGEMIFGAVVGFLVVNLPFALANPEGWFAPWRFHSLRLPNFETSWFMILHHGNRLWPSDFWFSQDYGRLASAISGVLFLVLAGVALWRFRPPAPRPYALSAIVLMLFLLTAKVYSPQFALWLLPFMVLLRVPWTGVAAFFISDAAVWVAISWYFIAEATQVNVDLALTVMQVLVVLRYLVLGFLIKLVWNAEENVAPAI